MESEEQKEALKANNVLNGEEKDTFEKEIDVAT